MDLPRLGLGTMGIDDLPEIIVSGLGKETATVAGRFGDGFITTSPNEEFVDAGFESVYLHHLGQDQEAFVEFMEHEVLSELN